MIEKLHVTPILSEPDAITTPERPAGAGWRLKTSTRVWNEEKGEGKQPYVWERTQGST